MTPASRCRGRQPCRLGQRLLPVERPDFDSDGVIASRLSAERLQQPCGDDPQTALAVLRALGQDAAARAEELAAATVRETGIGNVTDKTFKNRFASLEVNPTLQGKPGVGQWSTDERGVTEIASPVGVVLGLIPITNPVSTLVFKTLICLKAHNALIVSHHPAAVGVGVRTVELIRAVLRERSRRPAQRLQTPPDQDDHRPVSRGTKGRNSGSNGEGSAAGLPKPQTASTP
jgi:hypothetical protein